LIPIVEKRLYLSKNFSGLQKYLLEKAFEIGFLDWEHDDSFLFIQTFANKHTMNNNFLLIVDFLKMTRSRPSHELDLNKYSKQRKLYKLMEYYQKKGLEYNEPKTTQKLDELIKSYQISKKSLSEGKALVEYLISYKNCQHNELILKFGI
jgi:hypothetical protein